MTVTAHTAAAAGLPPQAPQAGKLRGSGSHWTGFAVRRAGGLLLSLFMLVVLTFMVVPLIPGDPAQAIAGTDASPETVAQLRGQMGLNDPLPVRFAGYVAGLTQLDLGTSFRFNAAVGGIIAAKLPY